MKKEKKGNLLKDMSVQEVSLVGRGANQGAKVSLFKSEESIEELAKQSFNEALSEMELSERMNMLLSNFYDFSVAMQRSFSAIIRNPGVAQKKTAIRGSLNEFMVAMSGLIDSTDIIKGDLELSPDEKTQLVDFFEKNKEDITDYYNNQIEGGFDMNELEKLQKKFDDLQKKFDDDMTASEVKVAKFEIMSKMNDVTKVYFDLLDEEGQVDFLKKDEKKWAGIIEKSKVSNETFTAHGRTICKSVVGEDVYEVLKAQQAEIDTNKQIAKDEKDARESAEFTKSAETLYKNLPGDPDVKGKVLKATEGLSKDVKEALTTMLKSGNEAMSKSRMFDEIGSGEVGEDSAEGKLNKMAEVYADENKVTFAKAYATVIKTKEGQKLYSDSLK